MILPFVRELLADLENSVPFDRVRRHLSVGSGRRRVSGLTFTARALYLPLFVRAGSIIPLGSRILSTDEAQAIARVLVYPGKDGSFAIFNDDGKTYGYEQGKSQITHLHWNDTTGQLTHEGAEAWTGSDASVVTIVGR